MNKAVRVFAVTTILIGGLSTFAGGFWSFFWPESFYTEIATYPPFSVHGYHDSGAFAMGVGAGLIACLLWNDPLLIGLGGGMVGTVAHATSHVWDRNIGGEAWQVTLTVAIAVVVTAAFLARLLDVKRREATS